jgi:hypothetical protein
MVDVKGGCVWELAFKIFENFNIWLSQFSSTEFQNSTGTLLDKLGNTLLFHPKHCALLKSRCSIIVFWLDLDRLLTVLCFYHHSLKECFLHLCHICTFWAEGGGGTMVWAQGFMIARQVLYHTTHVPSPFSFSHYWNRVSNFCPHQPQTKVFLPLPAA